MKCARLGKAQKLAKCSVQLRILLHRLQDLEFGFTRDLTAVQQVAENSMKEAAQEAKKENDGCNNIAVAVDGTWQRRGFISLNGVVTATSVDTGKVMDVEVLSKYCIWLQEQKQP